MSNIFSNVVKYAGKWDVVGESKLDAQDLAELEIEIGRASCRERV